MPVMWRLQQPTGDHAGPPAPTVPGVPRIVGEMYTFPTVTSGREALEPQHRAYLEEMVALCDELFDPTYQKLYPNPQQQRYFFIQG